MTELLVPLLSLLGSGIAVVGTWLSAKLGSKTEMTAGRATDMSSVIQRAAEAAVSSDPDQAQHGVRMLVALLNSKRVTDDQQAQIAEALRQVLRAATQELEELPSAGDQVGDEADAFQDVHFVTTWHRSPRQSRDLASQVPSEARLAKEKEQPDG